MAVVTCILEELADKAANRLAVVNQMIVVNDEDEALAYLGIELID